MVIRQATESDIDKISKIDKAAYGEYGGSREYFAKKLRSFPEGMLVTEDKEEVTGFTVLEIVTGENMPEDFKEIKLTERLKSKWMNIICFTTATNYADKKSDSQLLRAAENAAKRLGCTESCVPLTKDHPFKVNGVFDFWESNGYKLIGEVKWTPNSKEFFECYFYKKSLFNPQ